MTLQELITDLKAAGANENTIRLALNCYELGKQDARATTWTQTHWTEYEHAIAAAEREACAKHAADFLTRGRSPLGRAVAEAIRARGQQ